MPDLTIAQQLQAAEQTIAVLIQAGEANGCPDIRSLAIMDHCADYPNDALGGAVFGYLSDPAEDGD